MTDTTRISSPRPDAVRSTTVADRPAARVNGGRPITGELMPGLFEGDEPRDAENARLDERSSDVARHAEQDGQTCHSCQAAVCLTGTDGCHHGGRIAEMPGKSRIEAPSGRADPCPGASRQSGLTIVLHRCRSTPGISRSVENVLFDAGAGFLNSSRDSERCPDRPALF